MRRCVVHGLELGVAFYAGAMLVVLLSRWVLQ